MFIAKKIKNYPLSSLLIVAIWVVCLIPIPETPLSDVNLIDKWTHFVMYGSLTSVIWFEYIRRRKPLTRHFVTPSPQGARGEVSNETSKEGYAQEIVTSSSPLGERMPAGQVRGRMGHALLIGGVLCPIIMGGLIELAQAYLTTCRSGDIYDFFCNSLGVLLGCIIGLILRAILRG